MAMTHRYYIMEIRFTNWNSNSFRFFLTFFTGLFWGVFFFFLSLLLTLHLIQTATKSAMSQRGFSEHLCHADYSGFHHVDPYRTTWTRAPKGDWGDSPISVCLPDCSYDLDFTHVTHGYHQEWPTHGPTWSVSSDHAGLDVRTRLV